MKKLFTPLLLLIALTTLANSNVLPVNLPSQKLEKKAEIKPCLPEKEQFSLPKKIEHSSLINVNEEKTSLLNKGTENTQSFTAAPQIETKIETIQNLVIGNETRHEFSQIKTRAAGEPYCVLVGSIFQEDLNGDKAVSMTLNKDGTFTSTPGMTWPGNLYLVYNPGEEDAETMYLFSETGRLDLDTPMPMNTNGIYYLQFANRGEYTFTFDPQNMTLTVVGETLPFEYYLSGYFNNRLEGDANYKFSPLNDGTGNYTLSFEGRLTNLFLVNTGSLAYYFGASNGENRLSVGQDYQTVINGGNYIQFDGDFDVENPTLTFNPDSGMLLVEGEVKEIELTYAIYANFDGTNSKYYPMAQMSDGVFHFQTQRQIPPCSFYIASFNAYSGLLYNYYFSTQYETMHPGDTYHVQPDGGAAFFVNSGIYQFYLNPENMTLTLLGEEMTPYYLSGYFNDEVRNDPAYMFQPLNDGTGNYVLQFQGFLKSNYIIDNGSLDLYYGGNGQDALIPGVPFQSNVNSGYYIATADDLLFINPLITFNPESGVILIEGETKVREFIYSFYANIYGINGFENLTPLDNGTWIYNPNRDSSYGSFYIAKYDVDNNTIESYILNAQNQFVEPGIPMECSTDGWPFYIYPGNYSYTFDPEAFTLTVEGEVYPEEFFLISYSSGSRYKLTENQSESGIYGCNIPVLMPEYYIYSSYNNYYFSNGEPLTPGKDYQTSFNNGTVIQTIDNYNLFNVNVKFTPSSGNLYITAEESQPAAITYGIYGNIFSEDGSFGLYPLRNIDGRWTLENPVHVYEGDFTIIKYDAGIDFMYYYDFFGPMLDYQNVELGQRMECYYNNNTFYIKEGDFNFIYDPSIRSLLVYAPETQLPDAILVSNYNILGCNFMTLNPHVMNVNIPAGDYEYRIYYKSDYESEYSSQVVTLNANNDFEFTIPDLLPYTYYKYNIYLTATNGQASYSSDMFNLEFVTSTVQIGYSWEILNASDTTFEIEFLVYGNYENIDKYQVYYAVVPTSQQLTSDDLLFMETEERFIIKSEHLEPSTDYLIYVEIGIEIGDEIYYANPAQLFFHTGEPDAVESIMDDDAPAIYYDLNGHKVKNPSKGLYIEVKGNKSRKIFIH